MFDFLSDQKWTLCVLISVPSYAFCMGTGSSLRSLACKWVSTKAQKMNLLPLFILFCLFFNILKLLRWSVLQVACFQTPSLNSKR